MLESQADHETEVENQHKHTETSDNAGFFVTTRYSLLQPVNNFY